MNLAVGQTLGGGVLGGVALDEGEMAKNGREMKSSARISISSAACSADATEIRPQPAMSGHSWD